jgi:hypothetical protein
MTSTLLLSNIVNHYILNIFTPVTLFTGSKVKFFERNALRINFGDKIDHMDYCLFLASNSPYYGVLVDKGSTLVKLKKFHRIKIGAHTEVPKTVQTQLKKLPPETQVLILANATHFTKRKLNNIFSSWRTDRPLLLIG